MEADKNQIAGILSCYDRVIVLRTSPNICYAEGIRPAFISTRYGSLTTHVLPNRSARNFGRMRSEWRGRTESRSSTSAGNDRQTKGAGQSSAGRSSDREKSSEGDASRGPNPIPPGASLQVRNCTWDIRAREVGLLITKCLKGQFSAGDLRSIDEELKRVISQ